MPLVTWPIEANGMGVGRNGGGRDDRFFGGARHGEDRPNAARCDRCGRLSAGLVVSGAVFDLTSYTIPSCAVDGRGARDDRFGPVSPPPTKSVPIMMRLSLISGRLIARVRLPPASRRLVRPPDPSFPRFFTPTLRSSCRSHLRTSNTLPSHNLRMHRTTTLHRRRHSSHTIVRMLF